MTLSKKIIFITSVLLICIFIVYLSLRYTTPVSVSQEWVTFSEHADGVSFKIDYPASWNIYRDDFGDNSVGFNFYPHNAASPDFFIIEGFLDKEPHFSLDETLKKFNMDSSNVKRETLQINGDSAVHLTGNYLGCSNEAVQFNKFNRIYLIVDYTCGENSDFKRFYSSFEIR